MEKPISLFIVACIFLIYNQSMSTDVIYNVMDMGAKPDGETDSTQYFTSAWVSACGNPDPSTVLVPQGRYLVKAVQFTGPCNNKAFSFQMDGTLVEPSDYNVMGNSSAWLDFRQLDGFSIRGGILDGQGTDLWTCKSSGNNCPTGTTTLRFTSSSNIIVDGLTSVNSQMFHIAFNGCKNVTVQAVNVRAAGNSPNTDGIHVQFSTGVTILNSMISTGDDCISIGPGTTDLGIENVTCGPAGHGISIGSLGKTAEEEGVQNVSVKCVTFTNTLNGVRIKSWGRPSNGFVKEIVFQHATMMNVDYPIIIDQNYCPHNIDCPGQDSGIQIDGVTYQDIHGTSATEVAVKFDCSKMNPCSGIKLEDVKLTYQNQQAKSLCANVVGTTLGLIEPPSCF